MRLSVSIAAACLSLTALSAASEVEAAIRKSTNIPAQGLGPALQSLAQQRDFQVIYLSDAVDQLGTFGAVGELTTDEALTRLLNGTGLAYRYVDDKTVTVFPVTTGSSSSSRRERAKIETSGASRNEGSSSEGGAKAKSFWDRFRLAQVDQGQAVNAEGRGELKQEAAAGDSSGSSGLQTIDEIIVTAQKRSERLQDVPVPVAVMTADTLIASNQLQLQDYYAKIPGLSVVTTAPYGGAAIAIRGLSTGVGAGAQSVGIVIDDVPYSGAGQGLTVVTPEIDPTDVAQIEVLRGPQGTLYGANSLGGLIKYVTVSPSIEGYSGGLRTGLVSVKNGDGVGYSVSGDINVPIGDAFAVRASGFTREDPGYIDDPVHGRAGVNSRESSGGRLAALWAPSDQFSLKLSAMLQDYQADGSNDIPAGFAFGDLQQDGLPGAGDYRRKLHVYTAHLSAALGKAELTAISAYSETDAKFDLDLNPSGAAVGLGATLNTLFGVTGSRAPQSLFMKKHAHEVRLEIPVGESIDWLLGAYYASDDKRIPQTIFANNYATGAQVGVLLSTLVKTSFEESAAFTNVTFRLSDTFDIQVGGRLGDYESTISSDSTSGSGITTRGPVLRAKNDSFTYLVTPRLRISPDLMLYARVATGYRSGGANTTLHPLVPPGYDADKTQNYEIGVKAGLLDDALTLDASVYYIDWEDVQVTLLTPTVPGVLNQRFVSNAGNARSQGVELSVESRPLTGLTAAAWIAYNDAELTEDFPPNAVGVFARAGERLPLGAPWSGSISLDQEIPLGNTTASVGGSLSYVGERSGQFRTSGAATRAEFPSYVQTDLHAGLRFDTWLLDAFVTNVTDKRGVLYDSISFPGLRFQYIQPRTIGISAAKKF